MTTNERLQKFTKARAAMVQSQRFYGSLALRLTPVETARVQTTATDGRHFFFNGTWIDNVPMPELIGVIAHAVCSLANLHHTRRRGREQKKWQQASDLCVNPIIKAAGFQLPPEALDNPLYHGLAAEEIYFRLAQEEAAENPSQEEGEEDSGEGEGQGASGGPGAPGKGQDEPEEGGEGAGGEEPEEEPGADDTGGCGEIMDAANEDGGTPSKAELQQLESEQQVAVCQAHNLASNAGQGSSDIDRLVDELKKAQVDWIDQLRRWAQQTARSSYTWAKPNRRFIGQGIRLPTLAGTGMGEMVVVVDMSGSVTDWVKDFLSEISGIAVDLRPEKLHLVYCTSEVVGTECFGREDEFIPTPRGIGGTDLRAAFDWIEKESIDPACVVVLTDLLTPFHKDAPEYPVLWASTLENTAPWGETVHLKR